MRISDSTGLGAAVVFIILAAGIPETGEVFVEARAESPVVVRDNAGAKAHAGKQVAVKGIARDAKIAAVIAAENLVVYCLGLGSWPADMAGKPVRAHGRLEQTGEFAAKRGPAGEMTAGTDGPVWVLRGCRYKRR